MERARRHRSRALRGLIWIALAGCADRSPPPAKPVPLAPAVIARAPTPKPVNQGPSWIGVRFDKTATTVLRVIPGSPAELAGMRVGDEVVTLDGKPAVDAPNLVREIRGRATGTEVAIVVLRAGAQVNLTLVVEARPEDLVLVRRALVGKAAPGFEPDLIRGNYSASLADLSGQVVVLDFWATWCGPCAMTMPTLDAWQTKYGPKGLRIVGVSSEDRPDIQLFIDAHPLAYAIARDHQAKIARDYYLLGVPMLVVIDRTGIVRHVQLGAADFGAVEAAFAPLL